MLLKGNPTITNQKWGSMPRHAGSRMGPASDRQFSQRDVRAAFASQKRAQARHLHSRCTDETVCDEVESYRGGNRDRLVAKRTIIQ